MIMEKKNIVTIFATIIVAAAITACTYILAHGFLSYKNAVIKTGLTATGSASRDFQSDLIVWRGSFSSYGESTEEAYKQIKGDAEKIKKYLLGKGVAENEIVFSSVDIYKRSRSEYDDFGNFLNEITEGYDLSQSLTVTSTDIDKVEEISRDITTLIESGVQFYSNSPEYYCTTLDEVKLQLIELATDNAKARIDLIAKEAGCKVGDLKSANLGVFQITAKNSGAGEYSYDGAFDTSSRQKTAMITVKLNYEAK